MEFESFGFGPADYIFKWINKNGLYIILFNINILSLNIIPIYYETKLINKRNDIIILFS